MPRGTLRHMGEPGAKYVNLDCLTHNANDLYRGEGFEEVARHMVLWLL